MELTELVGTTDAARLAGVAICTVSSWKRKGLLHPVKDKPPLYTRTAVLAARELARQRNSALKRAVPPCPPITASHVNAGGQP